ncbi:Hypothetical predicted protein [Pelobates cultripes]|uniref:Uncharacterized protein n=1 Tax=Pelobates cultripes TaxID=61616 RepID=A0AAD1W828_PELCU|nr:Hypothetical predicted protein [Pelobates cultripes]
MRAHYYHIKEHILRGSKMRATPPPDYPTIKIYADLSAVTLRKRKAFHKITATLRTHGIKYKWGFPTKLLVAKDGGITTLANPDDGAKQLQVWNLQVTQTVSTAKPAGKLTAEWNKAAKKH